MSVPVESFKMPMTAISTSCVGFGWNYLAETHVNQWVVWWLIKGFVLFEGLGGESNGGMMIEI